MNDSLYCLFSCLLTYCLSFLYEISQVNLALLSIIDPLTNDKIFNQKIFTHTYPIFHSRPSIVPKTLNLIPISPFTTISFQLTADKIVIRIDERTHFARSHTTTRWTFRNTNILEVSIRDKNIEISQNFFRTPANRTNCFALRTLFTQYHVIVSRDDAICIARAEIIHETAKFNVLRNVKCETF